VRSSLRNKKPLRISVDNPAWLLDIYRRIEADESPYDLLTSESAHHAHLANKAWRAKVEAEAAEARRRRGGRPRLLSAEQINDAQEMLWQYMKSTGIRKRRALIDKVQQYWCERGIPMAGESTVIRHVVEPVRGSKKRSKE
jgi:hypothetical protein